MHYESTFVEIDKSIFKTNRNVIIGEIYKPPSAKIKSFNIELEKILNKIKKEKKYAFLMGDYNINTLTEIHISKHTQDFINILSTYYYHKLISLPSRQRNKSCTLIDNIYSNIPDCYNTCSSGVLKCMTQSYHYPIFTIRQGTETPKPKTHITRRNHSDKNIAKYKKYLSQIDWNPLLICKDMNSAYSIFIKLVVTNYKVCFPLENINIHYKNRNPWINKTLKKEIEIRDKLYVVSKKNPTPQNINNYKSFKNKNLTNQR